MGSNRSQGYNRILNSEKSFLFLSLSILESQGFPGLSALIAVIGPNNFMKLVRIYSGGNIKVPTAKELSRGIIAALYIYHKYVEPIPEEAFLKRYNVDMNMNVLHTLVRKWEGYIKSQGIDINLLLRSALDI